MKSNKLKNKRRLKPSPPAAGYTVKESQLAEIMLCACSLRHNATEIRNAADRMWRVSNTLDQIRETVKTQPCNVKMSDCAPHQPPELARSIAGRSSSPSHGSADLDYLVMQGGNGRVLCTRCGNLNSSGLGGWSQLFDHCMYCYGHGKQPNVCISDGGRET